MTVYIYAQLEIMMDKLEKKNEGFMILTQYVETNYIYWKTVKMKFIQ